MFMCVNHFTEDKMNNFMTRLGKECEEFNRIDS